MATTRTFVDTATAQTIAEKTLTEPQLTSYTIATLPGACTEGELAVVSDGDAAGSIIKCDSANKWRCIEEYTTGRINIACPPYNAKNANADNATEIQAALDELVLGADSQPRKWVFIPSATYTVLSSLEAKDDDANLLYAIKGVMGGASRIECNYVAATAGQACLEIATTAGIGNLLLIEDVQIKGTAGTGPDHLLYINQIFQTRLNRVWVGDYKHFGINLAATGHVVISNGLFGTSTGADTDNSGIYVDGSQRLQIYGNQAEDNAGAPDTGQWITLTGVVNRAMITNNECATVGVFLADRATPTISNLVVANNSGSVRTGVIHFTDNAVKESVTIKNNNFIVSGAATTGDDCMNLHGLEYGIVADNNCDGFETGIRSLNNTGTMFRGNTFRDIQDDVFWDLKNDVGCVWEGNVIATAPGAKVLDISSGTATGGNNMFRETHFGYIPGDLFTLTNAHADDRFLLADRVQIVTCTGATASDLPYYQSIEIDNNNAGGCTWTIGTGDAYEGQRLRVRLKETAGGTVIVGSDTITVNDVFFYEYTAAAWRKVN